MKLLKKIFSVMLALIIFLGANPGSSKTIKVSAAERGMKSVFSIDAGRKYFSLEQLKEIVDKAYKNGYTDVQVLLGNDALRFLLDDMSLEVNGHSYASREVKDAILEGNKHYYNDPNGNALTQAEMDSLIAYATERNIKLIPVINSPGHMDAILVAMEKLGIKNPQFNGSERTVDISNGEAIDFTKALIGKYINYFSKSCEIFNFGADEYANDVDTGGWAKLQSSGLYSEFVKYVNDLAAMIKKAGMTPQCFNDGIYYNSTDKYGTFDKDIIISYWTAGWWGYDVAKPQYFIDKGHKILNTNDGWYWVLGNIDDGIYQYNNTLKNIESKEFTDVPAGNNTPIIGSMQCVWCDFPEKEHDMEKIFNLMDAFSEKHSKYLIRPADYSKVDEAIAKIPSDLSVYTEETVQKLTAAKDAVVRGKKVDEQDVVDGYAKAIEDAIQALEYKIADYSKVDAAINKAESLNKNDYKDFSNVDSAINAVVRGLKITEQARVDAMAISIEQAIDELEKKDSDTPSTKPVIPDKPDAGNNNKPENGNVETPKTGDATNLTLWISLLGVSGVLLGFLVWKRRKEGHRV